MKIEEVIETHKMWKSKIGDYIHHPDKTLKPEMCHERCCELSRWMNSDEAKATLSAQEIRELEKAHKAFHHTLVELVINANRGVQISEEMALGIDSPFIRHSENMFRFLSKLKVSKNQAA